MLESVAGFREGSGHRDREALGFLTQLSPGFVVTKIARGFFVSFTAPWQNREDRREQREVHGRGAGVRFSLLLCRSQHTHEKHEANSFDVDEARFVLFVACFLRAGAKFVFLLHGFNDLPPFHEGSCNNPL
ncbi:hypothetical protein [Deinococcus yavapaiensis]|uniref:hypothetical protein n=1 Tax=Deinococcus yavapaiensis TaxID=309889 RepID=UPI0011B75A7D|nr:hypothetical protein [Deinococcus yavapaiensis]